MKLLNFQFSCGKKEAGQSLIEFALLLPFMALLCLGIVEIGRAAFISLKVANAATAGATYGAQGPWAAVDTTGVTNSTTYDANYPVCSGAMTQNCMNITYGTTPPNHYCQCDNGDGTSCNPPSSGADCTTISCTGTTVECVQVQTSASFTPLFNYPLLPSTFTSHGDSVMRVRH